MSNGSRQIPTFSSDFIAVGAWRETLQDIWHFIVWTMNGLDWIIHKRIYRDPMRGWHHIEISRTSEGTFRVWLNGTLETEFAYNDVTVSTYLEFYCFCATGAAIDNLVVDDKPWEPSPPIPWDLIVFGGSIAGIVIVVAVFFRHR